MNIVEYLKLCLVKRNLTFTKLASMTNQSQSNLANKVKRGKFQTDELEKIAEALNCELKISFIDKDTKEALI